MADQGMGDFFSSPQGANVLAFTLGGLSKLFNTPGSGADNLANLVLQTVGNQQNAAIFRSLLGANPPTPAGATPGIGGGAVNPTYAIPGTAPTTKTTQTTGQRTAAGGQAASGQGGINPMMLGMLAGMLGGQQTPFMFPPRF